MTLSALRLQSASGLSEGAKALFEKSTSAFLKNFMRTVRIRLM